MYDDVWINGSEFVRRADGMHARPDKSSALMRFTVRKPWRLYVGTRFTTGQRGELSKGMVAAMLRQLGIESREF